MKHFRIVNKLTTVGGGDTFTNRDAKPLVFFDQAQSGIRHQLISVDAIVLSDLWRAGAWEERPALPLSLRLNVLRHNKRMPIGPPQHSRRRRIANHRLRCRIKMNGSAQPV